MSGARDFIKSIFRSFPNVSRPFWNIIYPFLHKDGRWSGSEYSGRSEAFDTIFEENRWNNDESLSGPGSTLASTSMLQSVFDRAIRRTSARVVLDAPCGDFNWMRHIRLPPGTRYIGGDIVEKLAANLQCRYGDETRFFKRIDIAEDRLPDADLWLCRHVLFHLSNDDVKAVLRNFARSSIGYILTEDLSCQKTNHEITSGGFRFVNLRHAPFNLPKPLARFPNSNPPAPPDYLNLWSRQQIAEAVALW